MKERLVSRTSLTESQWMQKLLSLEPLGDQKPSQLLRWIEHLADKTCNNDPILQEIFLTWLPVAVQLILKLHPYKSTEQFASLADSLVAVTPEASLPGSFSTIAPVTVNIDTIASLRSELEDLKCQFSLQQKTDNFSPPSTTSPSVTLCWYHARFDKDATKCKKPCSMSGNAFPAHWWRPVDREITVASCLLLIVLLAIATWSILVPKSACFLQHVLTVRHSRRDSLSGPQMVLPSPPSANAPNLCTLASVKTLTGLSSWLMSANQLLVQIFSVSTDCSLTSSTTNCMTQKHPAAAFLFIFLTWKHSTSTIFLRHTIGSTPFSESSPNSLLLKWLTRHQHMVSSTALLLLADQRSQRLVDLPCKAGCC